MVIEKQNKNQKTDPLMKPEDRAEIRQMIIDAMASHSEVVQVKLDSNFEKIDIKLDAIKDQTTKTNGRVTTLETSVKTLQDKETERKAVKSFSWTQLVVISAIIGLVLSIIELILK